MPASGAYLTHSGTLAGGETGNRLRRQQSGSWRGPHVKAVRLVRNSLGRNCCKRVLGATETLRVLVLVALRDSIIIYMATSFPVNKYLSLLLSTNQSIA